MSMIYKIDNGMDLSGDQVPDKVREISVNWWIEYIADYLLEKQRSQSDRVSFGHYGEWFTPDILSTEFIWERI